MKTEFFTKKLVLLHWGSLMCFGRLLVWTAVAVPFFLLGAPATADDRAFDIPLQQGQGVSGNVKLHVSKSALGDLIVTVDEATITFMPHAGFNGLDETGGNLEIQGLLLVPQLDGRSIGADARVLVSFANLRRVSSTYTCAACGEGVVPKESLAESDSTIPALVVSNLIMFMPQENLAAGVQEPLAKSSNDVTAESSAQRLARIARAANLPIASLPNLRNLQSEEYSVLESLFDGIKDETGLDDITKSILASATAQAANMAYSPVLKKLLFDRFGLQSQLILKGFKANPMEYYEKASNSVGVDLLKSVTIGVAGSMVADAMFALKPLSDLPPSWKEPMRAMTKATVVETINLGTSAVDPSVAAAGIANRLYEFYQIYKASVALADTQNEAIVAAAIGLETAARLVTLNPSEKNNEIARSTITSTVTNLNEAFGDGYSVAMTEIVNLTFVGLLSEFRGDTDRAAQMVAHIREKGELGADGALPDVLQHPINWIASFATWSGDPPSRVAALMISSTVLNSLEQERPTAEKIVNPTQPPAVVDAEPLPDRPTNGDVWGPDIVPQNGFEVGSISWGVDCAKADAKKCLSDRGLPPAAVDFNIAAFPDAPDAGIAADFRELGVVDWVNLEVIYSPYEATLLVNGKPDIIDPEPTRDIAAAFSDSTSLSMLRRFPQAMAIGGLIASYRTLPGGQQRFVFVETVFDGCHACDVLGSAVTFLDFDTNGILTVRQPIGLNLGEPGQDRELTPDVLLKDPQALQTALNIRGYDAGQMDGFPGPQSRQALMEFQAEHCLPITGQPDQSTLKALVEVNGFNVPCPGEILPEGVSANSPLLAGMYVDDLAKCQLEELPLDGSHLSQRIVRSDGEVTFGYEGGCTVDRSDIRDGVTLFRGTCAEGNTSYAGSWSFDVQSNESFVDLDMNGEGTPRRFVKCAEDSPLRRAWAAWFEETATTVPTPEVSAPTSRTDLRSFCASNLNDPGPGEEGTDDPEVLASGGNTWRCMDGEVLVCDLGASGRACQQTSQPSDQVLRELGEFCLQNANSDYIAGYLIGGLADEWRCDGTSPVVVSTIPVDKLGYFVEAWHPLNSTPVPTETTPPETALQERMATTVDITGSNAPTEVTDAISSPIADGTYINMSAFGGVPGLCAESTIKDEEALRVTEGKLGFYEYACEIVGSRPSPKDGYMMLVLRCDGEGDQWEVEQYFQRTSEATFELGGEHYQGCLPKEWKWVPAGEEASPQTDLDITTDPSSTGAGVPDASPLGTRAPTNDEIALALVSNPIVRQHISRVSVSVSDCVPQEEVRRPNFRGTFWACSFFVTEVKFKESPPTGWNEFGMLTGSAESRFVQFVRKGTTQWTQRFAQSTNGAWAVQFIFR